MIPVLGCETTRGMLPGFMDGELSVADQVALEAHLRWCRTCSAHVEDLRIIGESLRLFVPSPSDEDPALDALQAGVVSRLRVEQDLSWTTYVRHVFDDLHVVWAAVGATVGVFACLLLTVGVIAETDKRASDSLAAIMDALGSPGSDENPMLLDNRMSPPRLAMPVLFDDSPELMRIPKNDAVLALSTVVTREGRIADYSLLPIQPARGGEGRNGEYRGDAAMTHDETSRLLTAVLPLRFAPAQAGGSPVAVNMVWLLARTTVKGTPRPFDFDEFRPKARGQRPVS